MALRPQDRERGLAAFNEARSVRRRAIVLGRVRVREVATRFWILTFIGIAIFGVAYYRYAEVELAARRHEVKARQRAVAVAMGNQPLELRDKLERWVKELAERPPEGRLARDVSVDALSRGPSIYLRLLLSNASDADAMRRAAQRSLRDGFTSCLFIARETDPTQGTPCKTTSQCGPGELCNDWSVCAAPSHPYNMKLLYDATRLLLPEWDAALAAAENDMQVRAIELDLEDAAKHEVPAAVTMAASSRYFTAVLDEPPDAGETENAAAADGEESAEQRVQASDHFVRVGIWDIQEGRELAALRIEAAGRYVSVGQRRPKDAAVERAQRRQANNCAAATQVRRALATGRVDPAEHEAAEAGIPESLVAGE